MMQLRRGAGAAVAVLALAAVPAAVVTIGSAATANADVCASAGRRVSVSGCANLSDVIAAAVKLGLSQAEMQVIIDEADWARCD
jgi:hypothetical protein